MAHYHAAIARLCDLNARIVLIRRLELPWHRCASVVTDCPRNFPPPLFSSFVAASGPRAKRPRGLTDADVASASGPRYAPSSVWLTEIAHPTLFYVPNTAAAWPAQTT